MMHNKKKDFLVFGMIGLYFIITIIISFSYQGTGDSGDSITHYTFSRHAFDIPAYFFHHWAKPLFVLVTAPFAMLGFVGMKIFNSIVASLTILITYLVARKMGKETPWMILILMIFAPENFTITFSGHTEPLSALMLALALLLILNKKPVAAAILVSFLPFARSEGLIFMGVFLVYFIIKKQYRIIPFLLTGNLIYAFAGYFVYHDLLWAFTKLPYAHIDGRYGSGPLLHFVYQLNYVVGIPIYILFGCGILVFIAAIGSGTFRKKFPFFSLELWLVYGSFFAFFVAHSLFWYLGLFDSMGLKRVFVTVIPLMALIGLNGFYGLRQVTRKLPLWLKTGIPLLFIGYIMVFPFSGNPASVHWKKELSLTPRQLLIQEVGDSLLNKYPDATYFHQIPYLGMVTNKGHREISEIRNDSLPGGAIIIWDNWFAVKEKQITAESLSEDERFVEIARFKNDSYEIIMFMYIH
jgi:hypothetical protein